MILALVALLGGLWSPDAAEERTSFQSDRPYSDRLDLRTDVAMVYGFGDDLASRLASWRDHGYVPQFMTGVAWGEYQDYLYGRFDGKRHVDEAQTDRNGHPISHGGDVYYMSPGKEFGKYLAVGVLKAIAAGAQAITLEEPEFWARGGYGEGFKRAWAERYGEPWQAEDGSPDARWRASKLKVALYRRALGQVFDAVRAYNAKTHGSVKCYVATHSLLNYASWGIVSPESRLNSLPGCDGLLAQVWTGTARTPNVYAGRRAERTFETAYLEYGSAAAMARPGLRLTFLADPVEDDPNHDWGDYERNYRATLVASLLQPEVARYEVDPWPNRVFEDAYPSIADHAKRTPVPAGYATDLQIVWNALKSMPPAPDSRSVGILVGDSLMYERGGPGRADPDLSRFYGLALPLLERGVPVQPVQLENAPLAGYLKRFRLLVATYAGIKPLDRAANVALAAWVRAGGKLLFVDDDGDPYDRVREWWNTGDLHAASPRAELFAELGLDPSSVSAKVGRGEVRLLRADPAELAQDPSGGATLVRLARELAPNQTREASAIVVRRGPYVVAAGLPASGLPPETLRGPFVDLLDPALPVIDVATVAPDSRSLLIDLRRLPRGSRVVACAGAVRDEVSRGRTWSAEVEGVAGAECVLLLRAPEPPERATIDGKPLREFAFDAKRKLVWLRFADTARPRRIEIESYGRGGPPQTLRPAPDQPG